MRVRFCVVPADGVLDCSVINFNKASRLNHSSIIGLISNDFFNNYLFLRTDRFRFQNFPWVLNSQPPPPPPKPPILCGIPLQRCNPLGRAKKKYFVVVECWGKAKKSRAVRSAKNAHKLTW